MDYKTNPHIITDDIKKELSNRCPKMKVLITEITDIKSTYIDDNFTALINSIIFQSISFKAATVIWNRFIKMFVILTPETVLKKSFEEIKSCGLSNSKTQYIFNIANAFHNQSINLHFDRLSDDEIKSELQKIKGIGPWTSEMFLIFSLNRQNVLSYGDIAIRKGLEYIHNLDHPITKKEFQYYKDFYSPYGTTVSLYLWEITLRDLFGTLNV